MVAHPGVGGGIETILRLERRYEIRRVTKLGEAVHEAKAWPAEAVLVDAAMIATGARLSFGAPALVLAASQLEGDIAARALDDARGWVAKDAASGDLVRAVERLLTRRAESSAGPVALSLVAGLLLIFLTLLVYLVWVALV
ncbi:MAG TPA: hypothetical protein VGR87_00145 [Candidatus Limnocylindria bacterium]|nr:hypothetical protein [Candidatus Limnocylindria bacterium]